MIVRIAKGFFLIHIFLLGVLSVSGYAQLYVFKLNDLSFGDVFIGYPAVVTDTDSRAAKFRFYQDRWRRRNIRVRFTLPANLISGGSSIPITFSSAYSTWSSTDNPGGRTNFNPFSPLLFPNLRRNDDIFIWLGASISPTGVPHGLYQGTITIFVEVY